MADFNPKIVAFVCNWCTYTGADLTGTSRIKYAPPLPCDCIAWNYATSYVQF